MYILAVGCIKAVSSPLHVPNDPSPIFGHSHLVTLATANPPHLVSR